MKKDHLTRCQVATPHDVVQLVWSLIAKQRPGQIFDSVLDLGAGDGRFSLVAGAYRQYVGIERDETKVSQAQLPVGARLVVTDAFQWEGKGYELCIGNPPYIRHHGLDSEWRDMALKSIVADGGPALKKTANAFVIFLAQALMRTKDDGLVAQVVPYEWVTRPSAIELRKFIEAQGWSVYVYRFDSNIFPTVLTTASIAIIDKRPSAGDWKFGTISRTGRVKLTNHASGTRSKVISYADGSADCKAIRGLSPGGQEIFVLTEEERLFYSLKRDRDVRPCVTSLRSVDQDLSVLDKNTFEQIFVRSGARCWLIRSDLDDHSPELCRYLEGVHADAWSRYSTCTTRKLWWRYRPHPAPALLVASGFTLKSPKVLVNDVGAVAVGSVYGVLLDENQEAARMMANGLRDYDFQRRLVHHSNGLKKIEVRQLNAVLADLLPR
ncbi:Eco57I restriction-modification methylase domain-containing protein [Pseudomonas gingeri]|uniref:site-specific DNA-methyltransferase (adenine-specific) n=1 Tax=Pseudomonas gingeri TaxID=117681 RepID=A0A7Y8BID1_9PSED|nr:class I SAM-dependent methyltransferase [Pseudomonas gingeri]NWB44861.1 Eco57I restriction-modification methylase domain-containing protein [Pseudomonas gingeri]